MLKTAPAHLCFRDPGRGAFGPPADADLGWLPDRGRPPILFKKGPDHARRLVLRARRR